MHMNLEVLKNKKVIAIAGGVLLLIIAMLVLLRPGKSSGGSGKVKSIQSAGKLVVAVNSGQNPALVKDGETYSGTEADLVISIAKALNVPAEYIDKDSGEAALEAVKSGEADIAVGLISDQMVSDPALIASNVYMNAKLYVATRRGDYSNSPAAFTGRKLDFSSGTQGAAAEIAGDGSGITVSAVPDASAAESYISAGEIDGYVCTGEEYKEQFMGNRQLQLQNLLNTSDIHYVVAAGQNGRDLIAGINQLIANGQKAAGAAESEPESTTGAEG